VYTIGGLVYALVLTSAWMMTAGDSFVLTRFLLFFVCYAWPTVLVVGLVVATSRWEPLIIYAWPTVLVVGLVVATSRWEPLIITCGYLSILIVVAIYVLLRNPAVSIGELVIVWLFVNTSATILLIAFLRRSIRAIGPLVLAFMMTGVTGILPVPQLAGNSERLLGVVVTVGDIFGLGATELFVLMGVVGFAAFGVLGWWLLGRIGRSTGRSV
jgi:hypothetical protein